MAAADSGRGRHFRGSGPRSGRRAAPTGDGRPLESRDGAPGEPVRLLPPDKVTSFAERYDSAYIAYRNRWRERISALADSAAALPLADLFRFYNSPEFLSRLQAIRTRTMEVDARGTWVGLEPSVAIWKRNMRIFADIAAHAEPGGRVSVVYGAGHAYFFRKWVLQHPRLELVEPADYLP